MLAQFNSISGRFGDASCYFLQVAYQYPGRTWPGARTATFLAGGCRSASHWEWLPMHRQQPFKSDPHLPRVPGSMSDFQDIKIGKNERYLGSMPISAAGPP